MHLLRAFALAAAWVMVAALIALGGAGIVATANHVPGTQARAELTSAGDDEVEPALDAATARLQALSERVDALGATARQALTMVAAGDVSALQDSISSGTLDLAAVQAGAVELDRALAEIPYTGSDWALHVSDVMHRRYEELASISGVTSGLESDWAAFSGQALDAATLTGLLARHDEETAAAAAEGSAAHYKQALALLDKSDATIARSRALQERLATHTDVSTLASWLDRSEGYDDALQSLYTALLQSKGRVTSDVRSAFAAEKAARESLPSDTRALVVIMSDIARGGLNQAVIAIEEARGSLSSAIEVQRMLKDEPQLPG